MNVLILGHKGLLGNMVCTYMRRHGVTVATTDYRYPSREFMDFVETYNGDFIINCIGAIHQKTQDFYVNFELPMWLDSVGLKVIHPGTDCETDDDLYGISKRIARDYIVNFGRNTKIIKTSIIGFEVSSSYSLLSWFLSRPDGSTVNGYTNQYWNGNTTLTWSEYCLNLIYNWDRYSTETIISSECISKYDLLTTFKLVFNKKITIEPIESVAKNKCLVGIKTKPIRDQLYDLLYYMK